MTDLPQRTFLLASYLVENERFFFTRKRLPSGRPRLLHNHDHHEIFWIKSGRGTHWINGARRELSTGDIVFIRPQDCHALQSHSSDWLDLVNLSISNQSVFHLGQRYSDELSGRFFWHDGELPWQVALSDARQQQLTQMEHLLENGTRSLARIEGFVLELTAWLGTEDTRLDALPSWLQEACRQAQNPEIFRQGPQALVSACGKGHEHVCRVFKAQLNTTPSAYINEIRMTYAARQLSSTQHSIEDIAQSCGIDNTSHFYKAFKRFSEMTPAAYRRRFRRDPVQPDA